MVKNLYTFAFSPDKRWVACVSDNKKTKTLSLVDLQKGTLHTPLDKGAGAHLLLTDTHLERQSV